LPQPSQQRQPPELSRVPHVEEFLLSSLPFSTPRLREFTLIWKCLTSPVSSDYPKGWSPPPCLSLLSSKTFDYEGKGGLPCVPCRLLLPRHNPFRPPIFPPPGCPKNGNGPSGYIKLRLFSEPTVPYFINFFPQISPVGK